MQSSRPLMAWHLTISAQATLVSFLSEANQAHFQPQATLAIVSSLRIVPSLYLIMLTPHHLGFSMNTLLLEGPILPLYLKSHPLHSSLSHCPMWFSSLYFMLPGILLFIFTTPIAQTVKNLPTMQETRVRSLGGEDPLEKGMASHFSVLS